MIKVKIEIGYFWLLKRGFEYGIMDRLLDAPVRSAKLNAKRAGLYKKKEVENFERGYQLVDRLSKEVFKDICTLSIGKALFRLQTLKEVYFNNAKLVMNNYGNVYPEKRKESK